MLEALNHHAQRSLRRVLEEAVAERSDPAERVRVVMDAMMSFGQRLPYTTAIVSTEPGFAMEFFWRSMPTYVKILVDILGPAVAEAPPVAEGVISAKQLAEILNRLVLSAYLLPTPGSDQLASRFSDVWYSLMAAKQGLEAPERRRRTPEGRRDLAHPNAPPRLSRRLSRAHRRPWQRSLMAPQVHSDARECGG